jgi:microcystin-dependent protein
MDGYLAQVKLFAATFAPRNWAFCQGQTMSIAQNTALFSLLGTTYGGNGVQTFALPNFASRVAVGTGQGNGLPSNIILGQWGGTAVSTLQLNNLPAHTHAVTTAVKTNASSAADAGESPVDAVWAAGASSFSNAKGINMNAGAVSANVNVAATGGAQPFSNMQPYLGMNFIICTMGMYPYRG